MPSVLSPLTQHTADSLTLFLPFFHPLETLSLPIERPPTVLSIPLSPNSSPQWLSPSQFLLISSTLIFVISDPIDFIRYIFKISCLFQFFLCLIYVDYYALSLSFSSFFTSLFLVLFLFFCLYIFFLLLFFDLYLEKLY